MSSPLPLLQVKHHRFLKAWVCSRFWKKSLTFSRAVIWTDDIPVKSSSVVCTAFRNISKLFGSLCKRGAEYSLYFPKMRCKTVASSLRTAEGSFWIFSSSCSATGNSSASTVWSVESWLVNRYHTGPCFLALTKICQDILLGDWELSLEKTSQ